MQFRWAYAADTDAIISVLKASLGESLMPKSEQLWHWKHLQNPFGVSPVLVACDQNKLCAVRAFMPWVWNLEHQSFQALRAVDTAVLPAYQGKGIFTKLTRRLLEEIDSTRYNFVFNTPNKQSLPGYLKLGWESVGTIPVAVKPFLNLPFSGAVSQTDWEELENLTFSNQETNTGWKTPISKEYLQWRYEQCPIAKYVLLKENESDWCIYRVKKRGILRELRLVELQITSETSAKRLWILIKEAIQKTRAQFLTASVPHAKVLRESGMGDYWVIQGPELTIRNVSTSLPKECKEINAWSAGLGSMEIF